MRVLFFVSLYYQARYFYNYLPGNYFFESLFLQSSDTRWAKTSFHRDNILLQTEGNTPTINPLGELAP